MERRPYYSRRKREERGEVKLTVPELRRLFLDLYHDLQRDDYFQEAMGYKCVDTGFNSGTMGSDIALFFRRHLRKEKLYPIEDNIDEYTEEDLFTVIEFLYDHVSKGKDGTFHEFADCGLHYDTFDRETGKDHFRTQINELISDFKTGYELSRKGQILESGIEQTSEATQDSSHIAEPPGPASGKKGEALSRKAKAARRGPPANMDYHRAVTAIVKPFGDKWRSEDNLERITKRLDGDKVRTPPSKKWAALKPPARSWERAVGLYRERVSKSIAHSLYMVSRDDSN